jgi:hypothetical protein
VNESPNVRGDGIDISFRQITVPSRCDRNVVAKGRFDHLEAITPNQASNRQIIAVARPLAIPPMASMAFPICRLPVEDAIAKGDLFSGCIYRHW